jgi:hypothetical protein
LIFWSKTPQTKQEKLKARQSRDLKAKIHQEHVAQAAEMQAIADKSSGYIDEIPDAGAGLDEDFVSKVGRKKQKVKETIHEHKKTLGKMRKRIRRSRRKAKSKAKSLGF